jgi:hypothetical protein
VWRGRKRRLEEELRMEVEEDEVGVIEEVEVDEGWGWRGMKWGRGFRELTWGVEMDTRKRRSVI